MHLCMHACVYACVSACARACVRTCVRACMHVHLREWYAVAVCRRDVIETYTSAKRIYVINQQLTSKDFGINLLNVLEHMQQHNTTQRRSLYLNMFINLNKYPLCYICPIQLTYNVSNELFTKIHFSNCTW